VVACKRHRVLAAAVLLLLSAGGGCKRKSDEGGDRAAAAVAAVEGISAIPASADVILGADVPALARSPLVERAFSRMLLADPGLSREVDQLFEGCGFRPERDLKTVLIAMDTAGEDRTVLVASGELREGAIVSCVGRHMAALGGKLVQTSVDGRPHYHADAPPDRLDVWFAFGSSDTAVVSSSPEFLAEALGDGPRLANDAELAALIERARRETPAVWAAGRVSPEVGEELQRASGGQLRPPRAVFGHLSLDSGLEADLGVVLASPDEAKSAVSLTGSQLAILAQVAQKWRLGAVVGAIRPEAEGDTIHLRLRLDAAALAAAIAPIDSQGPAEQTTAPLEPNEGVPDGKGDAAAGGEAPVPEQGPAD
jgi:hypothetical protein